MDNNYPYLLTATVLEWLSLLSKPEVVQVILDSMQYMQNNERMRIYSYVVMTNLLHVITSAENLSKEFGDFKSYTARKIIDYYKTEGQSSILKKLAFFKRSHKVDRDYQFLSGRKQPQTDF